eukprot:NODE_2920_length_520_cov_180.118896_g2525_i0.p1 GENE.NODE_2920_length_520_cov_180.118896_g2525_i0~~NODE_2920_length_520_cov_180.118896_g2525_i0.p1  ORF type:complete len:110 (-),score=35.56 NODE_2920_length_520_cov_180.118896_g2525_i0:190-489(-)
MGSVFSNTRLLKGWQRDEVFPYPKAEYNLTKYQDRVHRSISPYATKFPLGQFILKEISYRTIWMQRVIVAIFPSLFTVYIPFMYLVKREEARMKKSVIP